MGEGVRGQIARSQSVEPRRQSNVDSVIVGAMPRVAVASMLTLFPILVACSSSPAAPAGRTDNPRRVTYGEDPSQFAELWLPAEADALPPIVVLIHGGFWHAQYGMELMTPLAEDLVTRGFAVLNVEYRRVGEPGGGYPGTLEDVAAAIDLLALSSLPVDLANVVLVGHSAGGHLALWAAGRAALPAGAPGANPVVVPRLAIGLGPVFDLVAADAAGLGSGVVTRFIGGSADDLPDRYLIATPSTSAGVPLVVVRGSLDDIVPARFAVPTPIGEVTVVDIDGDDHFDLINPASKSWTAVIESLSDVR